MIKKPVVIITGVSGGIGLSTAKLFSERGWMVVGTVRKRSDAKSLAYTSIDVQLAEMTQPKTIEKVVQTTHKTYGRIDAVVANAGYALVGPLESLDYGQVEDQLQVNVLAVFNLCKQALPLMRKRKQGVLVAVSSIVGRIGIPGYSAYCASKFALSGLFEGLWYETKSHNIRVHLVEPSAVRSSFWSKGINKIFGPKAYSKINQSLSRSIQRGSDNGISPGSVAKAIYQTVTSKSQRLHIPVGNTRSAVIVKRLLPEKVFRYLTEKYFKI